MDRVLAELEVRHSRPIAPTRRVALGRLFLPTDPSPGYGGVLLAGIVAIFAQALDEEGIDDLLDLLDLLEVGARVGQPRLRHRFQVDLIGLDMSHHQLIDPEQGGGAVFQLEDKEHPVPQVLAAAYAAGKLSYTARHDVFRLLRKAVHWAGGPGPELLRFLSGGEAAYKRWAHGHGTQTEQTWALRILGLDACDRMDKAVVQRRYRDLIRAAHPDVGGDIDAAAQRITDLTEARRILLEVA